MRIPRRQTLGVTGIFHKTWRGHNREHVLESATEKDAYLDRLCLTLDEKITPYVVWYSYCLMGNHPHETGRVKFEAGRSLCLKALGNWMRNAHSRYGQWYNRRHSRQGKVAKTKEVKGDGGLLEVMFYGDANPVAAGLVSHPSRYRFSSYQYYAYGKRDRVTDKLTPPPEYLALGRTASARQQRYRELCDRYLRKHGLISDRPLEPEGDSSSALNLRSETPKISQGEPDTS